MKTIEGNACEYCGDHNWQVTATLISCKACGVVYGQRNGAWILDPNTVPQKRRWHVRLTETSHAERYVYIDANSREEAIAKAILAATDGCVDFPDVPIFHGVSYCGDAGLATDDNERIDRKAQVLDN